MYKKIINGGSIKVQVDKKQGQRNEYDIQVENYALHYEEYNIPIESYYQNEYASQAQSEFNEHRVSRSTAIPQKSKFKKMIQYFVAGVAGVTIITNTVETTTHNIENIIQNESVEMDNGQDEEIDILQNALNIYKSIIDNGNEIILFQTKDLEAPICIYKERDLIGSLYNVQMILNDNSGCSTDLRSVEYCQNDLIIKEKLDDQDIYVHYYKITDQGLEGFLYLRRAYTSVDNQNIDFYAYYIEDGVEVHFESEEEYDSYVSQWDFVSIDDLSWYTDVDEAYKNRILLTK